MGSGRPTARCCENSRSATTPTRADSIGVSTSPSSMRRPFARLPPGEVAFAGQVPTHGLTVTIAAAGGYKVSLTHLGPLLVKRGEARRRGSARGRGGTVRRSRARRSVRSPRRHGSATTRRTSIRCRCFRRGLPPYLRRRPRRRPHRRRLLPTPRPSRRSERRRPRRIPRPCRSLRRRLRLLLSSRLS